MPTLKMPEVKGTGQPTVLRWCKALGEAVKKGEVLLQAETEDQLIEIVSAADGALQEILSPPGRTVAPQTSLAVLGAIGSAAPAVPIQAPAPASVPLATSGLPVPVVPLSADSATTPTGTQQNAPAVHVVPILMPKAGQSMEEGMIVKWNVEPGAPIKKGQVIFVIETDKATVDVEAVDEGRLARIVVPKGETVPVQVPVAYLAEKDADVDAYLGLRGGAALSADSATRAVARPGGPGLEPEGRAALSAGSATTATSAAQAVVEGGRVKASPAARKLAEERGINLAALGAGSGPGGRILSTDVESAKGGYAAPTAARAGLVRHRLSQMRKAIARNLLWSKQNIPHFYLRLTINAEPLLSFYKQEKAKYPCSVNDVVVAACAKAIHEFPAFRCKLDGNELVETPTANIGVAVGMDEGLAVPVIIAAERLTLQQLGAEAKRLAEAARQGKIEGMGEGVFTLTNLGMFGVEEFSAIINPPEAAILAVGAAHEAVVAKDGNVRAGKVMSMTLSCDHRIVDGVLGAKFMARMKELLENPGKLV